MLKKVLLATLLIILVATTFAFANNDTASVKLVAHVPVRAIVDADTFTVNANNTVSYEVFGAELTETGYRAVADEVTISFTAI